MLKQVWRAWNGYAVSMDPRSTRTEVVSWQRPVCRRRNVKAESGSLECTNVMRGFRIFAVAACGGGEDRLHDRWQSRPLPVLDALLQGSYNGSYTVGQL